MSLDQRTFRPYRPRHPLVRRNEVEAQARKARTGNPHSPAVLPRLGSDADKFTIGLEEELFLVDGRTLDCVEVVPEAFMLDAKAELGDRVTREIIASMLELVTGPHASLSAAGTELRELRDRLGGVAGRHGLALMACGTHPFADWRRQTLSPKTRYEHVAHSLGQISKRIHVCGFHVHVAMPDIAQRISVMNRAQGYLPLLLALSTSSPFWQGDATGLKSYRSAAYDESPRTGLPIRFADAAEFDRFVGKMEAAGFIPDQSFLWWAIRPSLRYPTLELRIADSCTAAADAIAIAALYRCLVHALYHDTTFGAAWEEHHYLVNNENRWQAIRYGLGGKLLDASVGSVQPMVEEVRALVERLRPSSIALDCEAELDGIEAILWRGTSADRQSRSYQLALASGATPDAAVMRVASDIVHWTAAA